MAYSLEEGVQVSQAAEGAMRAGLGGQVEEAEEEEVPNQGAEVEMKTSRSTEDGEGRSQN